MSGLPTAGRRGCWFGLAVLICSLIAPSAAAADASTDLSARVRAAFLFNFARFAEWPQAQGATTDGRLNYCVANAPDLARALRAATENKQVAGQAVAVLEPAGPQALAVCDVVYMADAVPAWLEAVRSRPVLVVGEGHDFARDHGMIGFFMLEGRLRFAINPSRVEDSGLKMSSRLLKLAHLVGEGYGS